VAVAATRGSDVAGKWLAAADTQVERSVAWVFRYRPQAADVIAIALVVWTAAVAMVWANWGLAT